MTTLSSHIAACGAIATARTKQHIARRIGEVALAAVIVAALTGTWLAFFSFVPFDLTPHR